MPDEQGTTGPEARLVEGELRATSDRLVTLIGDASERESRKRHVELGSALFVDLADQVVSAARELLTYAEREQRLAREVARARTRGELPQVALDQVESRPVHLILADWREAMLRFDEAAIGSREQTEAAADAERWRREYRRLVGQDTTKD